MNALDHNTASAADNALRGVIEPLASYICAAERPRAALWKACQVLAREVERTDETARAQFGAWGHGR